MEQAFRRLERGISIFWVGGMMRDGREGVIFVGDLSETARDVSSIGETRRGREGESWNVGLGFEVARGWDRDLGAFEGLGELFRGEGGPSDSRESAPIHASRSSEDVVLCSRLDLLSKRGICVTNEIDFGRTGGGYARGKACGGLSTLNGEFFWEEM